MAHSPRRATGLGDLRPWRKELSATNIYSHGQGAAVADQMPHSLIVVGIDGSSQSYAALVWAARYAESTQGRIRAVYTWEVFTGSGMFPGTDDWDPDATTRAMAAEELSKIRQEFPDVDFELVVRQGHAGQVLVEYSAQAALLVLGCRGRGGFAGMLLGSTSTHCVHAAHCPVLVYR